MKLYNPDLDPLPAYVWPMVPKAYKPGQQVTYQLTKDPDPKNAELQGYVLAGPCQIGMYDSEGFYCTYRPAFGNFPGKYYRVLQDKYADRVKQDYENEKEKERIERRYPARNGAII